MRSRLFKKTLEALTELYLKPVWTERDFIKAQKLRDQILEARNSGKIERAEYNVLHAMESHLIKTMRVVLRKEK